MFIYMKKLIACIILFAVLSIGLAQITVVTSPQSVSIEPQQITVVISPQQDNDELFIEQPDRCQFEAEAYTNVDIMMINLCVQFSLVADSIDGILVVTANDDNYVFAKNDRGVFYVTKNPIVEITSE